MMMELGASYSYLLSNIIVSYSLKEQAEVFNSKLAIHPVLILKGLVHIPKFSII